MATRGENSELTVSLKLEDNLSGGLKVAKDTVDATANSVGRFGDKIDEASGKLRTFRRVGSEIGQVGRALGGDFEQATNQISDFVTTAGSAGLAIRGIGEIGAVAGLGLGALLLPLTVATVGIGAFVIAAQRQVTETEKLETATAVAATQVAILKRAFDNGQLSAEAYASRLALVTHNTQDTGSTSAQATPAINALAGGIGNVLNAVIAGYREGVRFEGGLRDIYATSVSLSGVMGGLQGDFDATGTHADTAADKAQKLVNVLLAIPTSVETTIGVTIAQTGTGVGLGAFGAGETFGAGAGAGTPAGPEGSLPGAFSLATQLANAKAAADRAAAEAARRAAEEARRLAAIYHDRVQAEFDAAKRVADTLFDALHRRHLQAIDDAEKLAQTRHDNTAQAIADQLKLEQAGHAAPVLAAQQALNDRQAIQQRRDLVEAQQAAAQELARNTDPANTQGLARALRAATEALQNFDASATIGRLQDIQQQQDAASEQRARVAAGINDAELSAAKQAADIARDAETIADQKRRSWFELELAALQKRDEALKKSPADIQRDIDALQAKFGITIDPITGFRHITDPLVTAIKNVHIEPPKVTVNNNQQFRLVLGANEIRLLAAAIQTSASPQSQSSTRTGTR